VKLGTKGTVMRFRAVAGLAAGILALSGSAVANASATAHPAAQGFQAAHPGSSPASGEAPQNSSTSSGTVWQEESRGFFMWYNPNTGLFYGSGSNDTPLSPAFDCYNNTGYCEHSLPNGLCMTWVSNYITAQSCQGLYRQRWALTSIGGGYFYWENQYADSLNSNCFPRGVTMLGKASGYQLELECPDGGANSAGTNQSWI
jgi:hypothetical protein